MRRLGTVIAVLLLLLLVSVQSASAGCAGVHAPRMLHAVLDALHIMLYALHIVLHELLRYRVRLLFDGCGCHSVLPRHG